MKNSVRTFSLISKWGVPIVIGIIIVLLLFTCFIGGLDLTVSSLNAIAKDVSVMKAIENPTCLLIGLGLLAAGTILVVIMNQSPPEKDHLHERG